MFDAVLCLSLIHISLNRATDTNRQPGSTFKIVSTYAPAESRAGA